MLIVLTPLRKILTDSCCHSKTLPIPLAMKHRSLLIATGTREKRQQNVARRTTAEYDGLVNPYVTYSKVFKGEGALGKLW